MFKTLARLIWGRQLTCDDPVFGHLITSRLKGRGRPVGDPPQVEWFAEPLEMPCATIEQVIVHAGRDGPTEEHRRAWLTLLDNHAAFREDVARKLYENYLWHKEMTIDECRQQYGDDDLSRFKSWPQYKTAEDTYRGDSWWLDIHGGEYLEFYISTDWDLEHNLRVSVQGGSLVDAWQD